MRENEFYDRCSGELVDDYIIHPEAEEINSDGQTCKNCKFFKVKPKKQIGMCTDMQAKTRSGDWCLAWERKSNDPSTS